MVNLHVTPNTVLLFFRMDDVMVVDYLLRDSSSATNSFLNFEWSSNTSLFDDLVYD
jgi:hypothetical protein